jgi:hypothetical protein
MDTAKANFDASTSGRVPGGWVAGTTGTGSPRGLK